MKWNEFFSLREAVDSSQVVPAAIAHANKNIDAAMDYLTRAFVKNFPSRISIVNNYKSKLIQDLRGILDRVSKMNPETDFQAESYEVYYDLLNDIVISEADDLAAAASSATGSTLTNVLNKTRGELKRVMTQLINSVAQHTLRGVTSVTPPAVSPVANSPVAAPLSRAARTAAFKANAAGIPSEHEQDAKLNLSKLLDLPSMLPQGAKIGIYPETPNSKDILRNKNAPDKNDLSSYDRIWHLVSPSKNVRIKYWVPGRKTPQEMRVDLTNDADLEDKLSSLKVAFNVHGMS